MFIDNCRLLIAMAGVYVHIPFCKQACHYCDFHFSTSLKKKEAMLSALAKEIILRKDELKDGPVETIYFGGGTPSILGVNELESLIETIRENYEVVKTPEITLEANPDDLTDDKVAGLGNSKINRLSIGIQSFFDADLKLMNRAHSAEQAIHSLSASSHCFENISIDLIYGIPGMDDGRWIANIERALSFNIPHISSYALTVEPRTALKTFIEKGVVDDVDDEQAERQFQILLKRLEAEGYVNYEISNFGKPHFFSKNNTAYWQQKPYLGIGPSAHSFDGQRRGWNIRNNSKYIASIQKGELPIEYEGLSKADRYNEYVMTGLRTMWGVSFGKIEQNFGVHFRNYLEQQSQKYLDEHLLFLDGDTMMATKKGKFLVDGIAADLFMLNLEQ